MSNQPHWKLVHALGDASPIDHGGYFVFADETGVYAPEAELWEDPAPDGPQEWTVYRFILEPCTFIDGILSDNKYHPLAPAWFADSLQQVADCHGTSLLELLDALCRDDLPAKACAWRMIGEYHGLANLDAYPLKFNRACMEARYAFLTFAKQVEVTQ